MAVLGPKVKFHMLEKVVRHPDVMKLEGRDGGESEDTLTRELIDALETMIQSELIHKVASQQEAVSMWEVVDQKRSRQSIMYEFSQLLTHEVACGRRVGA